MREETGGSTAGMDELMDYECLVLNVSGVFAALTSEGGRNLLNQSEVRVFLPTPVVRLPARPPPLIAANFRLAPALLSLPAKFLALGSTALDLPAARNRKRVGGCVPIRGSTGTTSVGNTCRMIVVCLCFVGVLSSTSSSVPVAPSSTA